MGSITVTNGSGAAFTEMGLKVNVDGATIEVDGTSKKVQIKNGGVTTAKILDNAVTKDKILDGAVAPLKIHGDIAGTGLTRSDTGVLSVNIGGGDGILGDGTGSDGDNKGAGKDVTSDGSITVTNGSGAAFTEMGLKVNVDGATIEVDGTSKKVQIKNGGVTTAKILDNAVTKDKILDGAVAPLKIHGDIAGTGLTRSDTGVLSVNIGGGDGILGDGTGSDGDNKGAGKDVTSDGSITVTNGSGAAFTEMGLKVNVDGATIEVDGTSKKVQIKNGGVTTAKIFDNAVTKDKILDGAVAPLKIHGDIAGTGLTRSDTGVLSVKIGDGEGAGGTGTGVDNTNRGAGQNVTSRDGSIIVYNGFGAAFTKMELDVRDGRITAEKIAANAVTTAKIADSAVMPLKIHEDIAGEGISRSDAGILSVDIGTTGIGQNVTSTVGNSITGGVNGDNAALTAMNLDVKVDNATIKINADTATDSTEKGKLYVNAPYSNDTENLTIRKWFGGKDIYEIVKTVTTAASSTKLVITGGIFGLTQVLNIRIIADAVTGGANANAGGVHHSGKYTTTEGNAVITVGSGKMSSKLPAGTYFIIIEYLK